jgi:hypothetical protein
MTNDRCELSEPKSHPYPHQHWFLKKIQLSICLLNTSDDMDSTLAPELPGPFDPLPVCPPGMLVGTDGLPAKPGGIVSEEWLRARPNAITLPPDGTVKNPSITDDQYPLRISWDGILVEDYTTAGGQSHPEDIVHRVREVLNLLWKDKAFAVEQEICDILEIKDLENCWEKLGKGEYDWAHLAYTIWPDRVKEKCKTDKSLAIAHNFEVDKSPNIY